MLTPGTKTLFKFLYESACECAINLVPRLGEVPTSLYESLDDQLRHHVSEKNKQWEYSIKILLVYS